MFHARKHAWRLCNRLVRYSSSYDSTTTSIPGFATTAGTIQFLKQSKWTLHHHLQRSDLYMYPIIHGPPKRMEDVSSDEINHMFAKALLQNHANCLYVYDHDEQKTWHTTILHDLLLDDYGISRENVVTVAGLGLVTEPHEAEQRLIEAQNLTKLQNIDIAIVEVIP
jgi:hypothetical protein